MRHQRTIHGNTIFTCEKCEATFTRADHLHRHVRSHITEKQYQCQYCRRKFHRPDVLNEHSQICSVRFNVDNQYAQPTPESEVNQEGGGNVDEESDHSDETNALDNNLTVFKMHPRSNEKHDLSVFLEGKSNSIIRNLERELIKRKGLKYYLCCRLRLVKHQPKGDDIYVEPHFRSLAIRATNVHELRQQLRDAKEKVKASFVQYMKEGSGWQLDEVLHLDLCITTYTPLSGSSYLPLPEKLRNKRAILNVQNDDTKCFLWSVLASLHPVYYKYHPYRLSNYRQYESELNTDGINFPMSIDQLSKFEKQNEISVNVFGYEKNELFPLYITKEHFDRHVNLLLISQGTVRHYCLINNLNTLLYHLNKHKACMYYCHYCLHGFIRQDLLDDHLPHCQIHGPQKINLPDDDHSTLQFKDYHKRLKVPFVIYADFESLTIKIDSTSQDPTKSSTEKYQQHEPCGFSYMVVCEAEQHSKPPVVYRGPDAVDKFLESVMKEEKEIREILTDIIPMNITPEQEREFQLVANCHICEEPLGTDRVRDHCHLSGNYRGAAHNYCNLNYKFTGRVPVIFHNLRGYDSHLIMQGLGKVKNEEINCIPNNMEKYISFSIGKLDFIDSLQFMNSSLERLISNLAKEGSTKFHHLKKHIPNQDQVNLLLRKGIYPYDYMGSVTKFQETTLPPKEAFYSQLRDDRISDEDYTHALRVYSAFNMKNLGQYHDLYLKSDVLLLADVFENFRSICLNYYELDPCHFYTSPGLAWQACLKMTDVELELLTDPDMYLFVEEGLRGGISMISNRMSKANNPYVPEYDPEQERSYITYLDANNLYGWAMSQALPTGDFEWLTDEEIETLDFEKVKDDSEEGFILEVDLDYPQHLHDLHNDYPLAPEKMKISPEMLFPYCQQLAEDLNLSRNAPAKLVPNLQSKSNYVIHYRNLKLYLSLGMTLKKAHRVLRFQQSKWLKTYIEFNTEKRKQASNDFEKDFFKLMNNSVFGKTMENLRRRMIVKLVNNVKKLTKLTSSPSFNASRIFSEDLAAVNMRKPSLYLNCPIYVGFAILDLSKVLMYDFHYNHIKRKYHNNAKLLFTDTDSLCYEIKTHDIYQDMAQDAHLFDTSDYPPTHPLHSTTNKKVLGKMKDETAGTAIEEFVGLRPKMYSLLYTIDNSPVEKKTAKGISKNVTKRKIRHADYIQCLLSKQQQMASMNQIRSFVHNIYSIKLNKIGLSPYDDKRYLLDNGCDSLAYGHYLIEGKK